MTWEVSEIWSNLFSFRKEIRATLLKAAPFQPQPVLRYGTSKIQSLRDEILLNPNAKSMAWLVDLAEVFVRGASSDLTRIHSIVKRNPEVTYIQKLGQSILKRPFVDNTNTLKTLPEVTPFQVIRKNLELSKIKEEGVKKQREYLKLAVTKGEQVGAREIFLRQENSTLEAI